MEQEKSVSRRRVLLGAGAGGLGILAAATLAPGVAAADSQRSEGGEGLTGSWLATVTADGALFPPFQSVLGFASGNVLTTVDSNGSPAGLGTWEDTGEDGGFAFTFFSADTDQNGKPTGGFDKIRGTGAHTGNHISGKFTVDGPVGGTGPFSFTGTFDGERIVVEPL